MLVYKELLSHLLKNGKFKKDRTGTGTYSVFGHQMRFDLSQSFPLLTTKKLHTKSIIYELLWFLQGRTDAQFLIDCEVKIWDQWFVQGTVGPMYGEQWMRWKTRYGTEINQLEQAIQAIKNNPDSRRIIVSAWNPADLPFENLSYEENVNMGRMSLAPCHVIYQFYVSNNKLSCMLTQRSADVFLGLPFNIASYSILTHLVANQCDLEVGEFIWSGGDVHLYSNHVEQAELQLSREVLCGPQLKILRKAENIASYRFEDIEIQNYNAHPTIKAPIAF